MVVKGKIVWISGPAVKASGMAAAKMYEVVQAGEEKLVGELVMLPVGEGGVLPQCPEQAKVHKAP